MTGIHVGNWYVNDRDQELKIREIYVEKGITRIQAVLMEDTENVGVLTYSLDQFISDEFEGRWDFSHNDDPHNAPNAH